MFLIHDIVGKLFIFSHLFSCLQNKVVMSAGLAILTGCVVYIAYMNATAENKKESYMALGEDGKLQKRTRTSKWD